jgi:hypothetical protein
MLAKYHQTKKTISQDLKESLINEGGELMTKEDFDK